MDYLAKTAHLSGLPRALAILALREEDGTYSPLRLACARNVEADLPPLCRESRSEQANGFTVEEA